MLPNKPGASEGTACTVKGANPTVHECAVTYVDSGSKCVDLLDDQRSDLPEVVAVVNSQVNADAVGDYPITYNSADAAGNASDTPLHCAAENNDTGAARALQLHARRVAVCVTLAMAQHLRLGAGAEVVGLGAELVREVLALAEM